MSNMYLTKSERRKIYIESIAYIVSILLASYLVVCDNIFIRMIPMLYILGIIGRKVFNKPIITSILGFCTILIFGVMINSRFDMQVVLLAVYSLMMILAGETTGFIISALYQNFKLTKFIKHYTKIIYVVSLFFLIVIPIFLNNLVNSNIVAYAMDKSKVEAYIVEHYSNTYDIKGVSYTPAITGGMYEFIVEIDSFIVKLDYCKGKITDVNLMERADAYEHTNSSGIAKVTEDSLDIEINRTVKINSYTDIKIEGRYDYSEVKLLPDIIKINIELTDMNIENVVKVINDLKTWEKFSMITRVDIVTTNRSYEYREK